MRSKPWSFQEHLEVVPPSNDHKDPQNKPKKQRKKTRKQGKKNGSRPRTKLSTTKPQTLKPSLPTEAAEGKQQQQHQDHDQRLLRHAAYQKHPYPCDYDSVQRSRTWSPRETSPYPLPPPRAPPKKRSLLSQTCSLRIISSHRTCNNSQVIQRAQPTWKSPGLCLIPSFLGSLLAWLGLAFLCFALFAQGAASDATVRDKKNSLTWEKTKHEVTSNTIGCATNDEGNQHVATLQHADHSSNGSRTSYH